MFQRGLLTSLIVFLFFTQCLAQTSISLTAAPTPCIKACILPAVEPQCPPTCPNSCTFVAKDPCCPNVKTGICDISTSVTATATTSFIMGTLPSTSPASSILPNVSSPTPTPTIASSSLSAVSSSSSAAVTATASSSANLAGDMINARYGLLAFMFTLIFLF
ncbi:hypothetical protein BGW37DRAFT_128194 [Umbelopsis sp. PMI_123]|nr:hypothetical protein BGW37DRAFT_128194 [Umbelopsis sp. PMI_123]